MAQHPATQWEGPPEQPLAIPAEITCLMRFRYTVYIPQRAELRGECASWDALPGGAIRLYNVLTDTSERTLGATFKKRVTHRQDVVITGVPVVVVQMNPEELEARS